MKAFLLMMLALAIIVIAAPIAFVFQLVRLLIMRKSLAELFWAVAIGLDQLGGSIIYLEPDWTVSSRTYWLRINGNGYAAKFEKLIDFFFGKDHCQLSYINEFGNRK